MGKVLAAYGGGFKPPTKGHFEIVQKTLNEFPEIDEFFIYVGGKERDGIDQFEAIQVWDIYKKYLANAKKNNGNVQYWETRIRNLLTKNP